MKRHLFLYVAALLGLSCVADAELRSYDVPKSGVSLVDSLSFRRAGNPTRVDTLIGASRKDTTTNIIPLAGLKSWAVNWLYTDAPGPTTSGTWALRCTLQVSIDSTNWISISPGQGVWAHTASRDTTVYQVLYTGDLADSAVGVANGPFTKRMIDTHRFARFILTVANSADDTVYVRAVQSRIYGD